MMLIRFRAGCLFGLLLLCAFFIDCQTAREKADLILTNGVFYTVDEENPLAEAVAIRGGRILAVGDSSVVSLYRGDQTRIMDLQGKFGCPAFNDAHIHLRDGAFAGLAVDFSQVHSFHDMQRLVLKHVRNLPPGAWLIGEGWNQALMQEKNATTHRVLDAIAPHIPMFIRHCCGHMALVNGKALHVANIGNDTPNPIGGEIERDERGQATGILKEEAMQLVRQYMPLPQYDSLEETLPDIFEQFYAMGITSIQDFSDLDNAENYQRLLKKYRKQFRISRRSALHLQLNEMQNAVSRVPKGMLNGNVDGSLESGTAALFEPYANDPDNRGLLAWDPAVLSRQVVQADAAGYQLGLHAIGDLANHIVLNAYELAERINHESREFRRHRIEHAQLLKPEDIERAGAMNLVASMQPLHCVDNIAYTENSLGKKRCQYAYPWRSLSNAGCILAFGSDWPFYPLNPMKGIYAAVTRRDSTGSPPEGWIAKERLTVEAALKAYTLGAAYAEFQEKEKGSLEAGKAADLIVLDRNLLTVEPEDILKTRVIATIFNGSLVYERKIL